MPDTDDRKEVEVEHLSGEKKGVEILGKDVGRKDKGVTILGARQSSGVKILDKRGGQG